MVGYSLILLPWPFVTVHGMGQQAVSEGECPSCNGILGRLGEEFSDRKAGALAMFHR